MHFIKKQAMRYGENSHQKAAFYVEPGFSDHSVATAVQFQGKALSYNNISDTDAALECVKQFSDEPACVIVKHANPCGVALAPTLAEAYERAFATDKESAFGGIIAFNRETCKELKKLMPEYKVYWLTSSGRKGKDKKWTPITVDYVLEGLKETGADGVDCHFDPKVITADFIKAVKDKGYEFHVWTVDRLDQSLLAFERGAQTVTTNCAKKQLDEYKNR